MSTTTALAGTFNADPVHSSFGFAVKYQNVSLFRGTLDEVAATLVDGKLEGTAQVESISIRTPEQFRAHVLERRLLRRREPPDGHVRLDRPRARRGRHRQGHGRPDASAA